MSIKTRRDFLRAAGAAAIAAASAQAAAAKPNVLILLSDDQGYGDIGAHGNPVLKTPALDKLHGESVRLTDFHAAPMCTPARGQLLTGQDALHNGATSVTAGRALVRRGIPTMGDVFSANGYATGLFGKWHIGDMYPFRPMDRGFQEAKYFHGFGLSSAPEFDNDYFNGRYRHNGVEKRFPGYCTDFWFDEAIKWMGEQHQNNKPFFCYLPTNVPHGPAWVDEKYSAPYKKPGLPANFFGMIANFDENAAKLDAFLKQSGLRENTIVIFMTDNGGTGGVPVFNSGMRGRKTQVYDGGHRVPCFVRWPAGGLRKPSGVNAPAQMQDWLPTLIDLCELKKPANAQFDGASLAPLLKGKDDKGPDRMLVVQYGQQLKKWDSNVIWNQWRLINGTELYDFHEEPSEEKDLAPKFPQVVTKMRGHYEAWWNRVEPALREFEPISIGSPKENPVTLTSSDWEDVYCDNVNSILTAGGGPQGGPWAILVERDGEYEIVLRRWPVNTGLALDAPCPEKQLTVAKLPAGKALPIAQAQLRIAGLSKSVKAAPGSQSAVFRAALKSGTKTKLHGWFQDSAGADLCGAYYAYVRHLG